MDQTGEILRDVVDCFAAFIAKMDQRMTVARELGTRLGLPNEEVSQMSISDLKFFFVYSIQYFILFKNRVFVVFGNGRYETVSDFQVDYYCKRFEPSIKEDHQQMQIGRSVLPKLDKK